MIGDPRADPRTAVHPCRWCPIGRQRRPSMPGIPVMNTTAFRLRIRRPLGGVDFVGWLRQASDEPLRTCNVGRECCPPLVLHMTASFAVHMSGHVSSSRWRSDRHADARGPAVNSRPVRRAGRTLPRRFRSSAPRGRLRCGSACHRSSEPGSGTSSVHRHGGVADSCSGGAELSTVDRHRE